MNFSIDDIMTFANDSLSIDNIAKRKPFIEAYVKQCFTKLPKKICFQKKTQKLVKLDKNLFAKPKDCYLIHDIGNKCQDGLTEKEWEDCTSPNNFVVDDIQNTIYTNANHLELYISYWAYPLDDNGDLKVSEEILEVVTQYVIKQECERLSFGSDAKKYMQLASIANQKFAMLAGDLKSKAKLTTRSERREIKLMQNKII